MREPGGLGTVVRDADGWLWARFHDGRWYDERGNCKTWDEIDSPIFVHQGYAPPTLEPTGTLAVIRDGEGVLRYRIMDCLLAVWARADDAGFCPWDEVPQEPNRVEILFPGVPDA
jgi:hypothetical protein